MLPLTHAPAWLAASVLLVGSAVGGAAGHWLMRAPFGEDRSSYSPLIVLVVIVAVVLVTMQVVHRYYHGRVRRADPWDCGYPLQTPRMQDTAEGFGQPVRQVFEPLFRMTRELPGAFDAAPRYRVTIEDHLWYWCYLPVARLANGISTLIVTLQGGRIAVYLMYSFITLVVLLAVVL